MGGHIFIAWPWTGNDVFFKAVNFHTRAPAHTLAHLLAQTTQTLSLRSFTGGAKARDLKQSIARNTWLIENGFIFF